MNARNRTHKIKQKNTRKASRKSTSKKQAKSIKKTAIKRPVSRSVSKRSRTMVRKAVQKRARSAKNIVAKKAVHDVRALERDRLKHVNKASVAKKAALGLPTSSEAKKAINDLMQNDIGINYLKKNVSRSVADVISLLTVARTDEYIAEKLDIKINAVRRMLNIMQNYGITNYYISKNKNGWLSFAWYMNTSKLPAFLEYVRGVESERSMVDENCNDYFICNDCYKENKLIFTFDAAYEAGFACNACGKNLNRLGGKDDVERLLNDGTDVMTPSDKVLKARFGAK